MKILSLSNMGQGKDVAQVELVQRRTLKSDGTSSWTYWVIGPVFQGLGPRLDHIVVHIVCDNRSSGNLTFIVRVQRSYNGLDWQDGSNIISTSAEGYSVSAEYSTRTDFGLFTRFQIGLTDVGAVEQGTFSAPAALKFWT